MVKIDFKQPKYLLPIMVFLPLCFIIYFVGNLFDGDDDENAVPTDEINANLPEYEEGKHYSKIEEMQMRYRDDAGSYSAVGALGEDEQVVETIEQGYSDDELNRISAEEAERIRQQKELAEMQRSLATSQNRLNNSRSRDTYSVEDDYDREMEEMTVRAQQRKQMYDRLYGTNDDDAEERLERQRADSIRKVREREREQNRPALVLKSPETNAEKFNTVSGSYTDDGTDMLIRAIIDQTTKAQEGTRIRFKLLDAITIKDVRLQKGSYLYGIVSGFEGQRVKVNISSILVGNRFLKVDLSVFDNDGMEGFYVPSSVFREMVNEAAANTVSQSINFSDNSGGYGFNAEALGLQALQNIYNSASSAIAKNIKKNKAKIKYSTVVYLINSKESR